MSRITLLIVTLVILTHSKGKAQTMLMQESFESDGEGSRYTSNDFNNACHDYFERIQDSDVGVSACVTNTPGSEDGNYYWAGEDCDAASGGEGLITFNSVNVVGYDLDVDILLAVGRPNDGRFEPSDYLILEYNMDGTGWNIFGALYGNNDISLNGNLTVDTDLDGTHGPGGAEVTAFNFANFNFTIPTTGSSVQIRVRVLSSGGTEEILLDNIRINGTVATAPLTASITAQTNVLCSGQSTGTLTVTASDGTAPYTYLWSSGGTAATESNLASGTYTVTVTDAGGTTATASSFVSSIAPIVVTIGTPINVDCYGASTGSLTASVTGGTTPYTYHWSSGETTPTISNKPAGNYTVYVQDANGCGDAPPP